LLPCIIFDNRRKHYLVLPEDTWPILLTYRIINGELEFLEHSPLSYDKLMKRSPHTLATLLLDEPDEEKDTRSSIIDDYDPNDISRSMASTKTSTKYQNSQSTNSISIESATSMKLSTFSKFN